MASASTWPARSVRRSAASSLPRRGRPAPSPCTRSTSSHPPVARAPWAATTPELVPREDLVGAIALNGIGFTLARALGPALGGFVLATAGPAAAFALNALTFFALLGALVAWRRPAGPRATMPRERLF